MNIFTLMGTILVDNAKAEESISSTGKSADGLASKLGTGLKTAAGVAAGALVAIGTAAAGMAVKAVSASDECKKALNTLQTQTGATSEKMDGLKESLLNIYGNNYGESFEDVAQALASVKQQTGLAGQELEGFTTNALALRDTFEYEITESTRAADMMMKQFGISGEEAFNLIAQGAQNGLDKNDNLLDSINEYSVHFAQLGLDAEDMFNMFSNGAQTGVFDIDKLGDAVKEFGIRVKDGTADEAFEQLGLNADKLKIAFAEGGEGAEQAFQQVNEALANCDDKVLQNTLGVTMYGTMWEDMGSEAVAALANTNGEFDKTKNTMEQINAIKYDSFSEAMDGIGRQIEVGLLIPLGDKLLPYLNDFANWINSHMPEIQAVFEVTMDAIGSVIDTIGGVIEGVISYFTDFESKNVDVSNTVKNIWEEIKNFFDNSCGSIKEIVSSFLDALSAFWNTWGSTITTYVAGLWEEVKIVFDTAFKAIQDIFNIFAAAFSGDWEGVWYGIKQLLSDVLEGINTLVNTHMENIRQLISNITGKIKEAWSEVWEGIKNKVSDTWTNIKTSVQTGISNVLTKVNELKNKAIETIKELPSKALQVGKDFVQGFINGIGNMIGSVASKARELANSALNTVKSTLGIHSPSRKMMELGGYTAEGMALGIEENADMVNKAVEDMTAFKDDDYSISFNGNAVINTDNDNTSLNASSIQDSASKGITINMYYPQVTDKQSIKTISRQLKEQITQGDRALGLV